MAANQAQDTPRAPSAGARSGRNTGSESQVRDDRPLLDQLAKVKNDFEQIYVILSPPRCSSTALARLFWGHPAVRCYLHEPFERTYFLDGTLDQAIAALERPIELRESGAALVIKEMTFQVGEHFPILSQLTDRPLVFTIRDPRLSIRSRMDKRRQDGDAPIYPEIESGWHDLARQIERCREDHLPYVLLDSTAFRNSPQIVLSKLFARLGLEFFPELLHWHARENLPIANFGDDQRRWYRRVLESTGIEPATETIPDVAEFPRTFQPHVEASLAIYRHLLGDSWLLSAGEEPTT